MFKSKLVFIFMILIILFSNSGYGKSIAEQNYDRAFDQKYGTNTMIAKKLKLPINCVTGRIFELRKKGIVTLSHTSWCPITRNKAKYWRIIKHG